MLAQKIELFGIASIWISSLCAHKHQRTNNPKNFKRDATIGITACGIVIAMLPL